MLLDLPSEVIRSVAPCVTLQTLLNPPMNRNSDLDSQYLPYS